MPQRTWRPSRRHRRRAAMMTEPGSSHYRQAMGTGIDEKQKCRSQSPLSFLGHAEVEVGWGGEFFADAGAEFVVYGFAGGGGEFPLVQLEPQVGEDSLALANVW